MKTSGARGIEARGGCGEEVVLLRRVAEFELAEVGAVGGGELRGAPACVGERTDRFVRRNISHDARTAKVDVAEGYFYGSKCREGHDHAAGSRNWTRYSNPDEARCRTPWADTERKRQVAELAHDSLLS